MSQEQMQKGNCADCFHPQYNHHDDVCTGDLTCMCPKYNPPYLAEFAQRIDEEKYKRKKIFDRVYYILDKIPQTRNAGEKTFYKIYIEIWEGFKIRKGNPQSMDSNTWKRLPNQDTINREKRRVKQKYPELATYNNQVLYHQSAIFEALMELSAE